MISSVHPHAARVTELKYLGVVMFLGLCLIGFILFLGTGARTHTGIPGFSAWELFQVKLPKIALFAIPSAVTVAVGLLAMVTKSSFVERGFNINGYSSGETTFIVLGIWIFAAWPMSHQYPSDLMVYTRQELTWFASSLGPVIFGLFATITRGLR
jgi:hypothetical protein